MLFVRKEKMYIYFFQQFVSSLSLLVSVAPFWILPIKRKQCMLFCIRLNAIRLGSIHLASSPIQKSVSCMRSMGNIQNGATLTRRDREEMNCWKKGRYFYFFCIEKVFSSLHKIQIEPLMADGLPWPCFSFFSGLQPCYLLGSQRDNHKPPGFYLKYLKLCSEDELSFYGVGTTCG